MFLNYFDINFVIPLDWGSFLALGLVVGLMAFGILAHTKFGTVKSQLELTTRQNPSFFAVFNLIKDVEEKLISAVVEENKDLLKP